MHVCCSLTKTGQLSMLWTYYQFSLELCQIYVRGCALAGFPSERRWQGRTDTCVNVHPCVWSCEPARHPSGWTSLNTWCTWTAARLKHSKHQILSLNTWLHSNGCSPELRGNKWKYCTDQRTASTILDKDNPFIDQWGLPQKFTSFILPY